MLECWIQCCVTFDDSLMYDFNVYEERFILVYGVYPYFQQYFSYISVLLVEETGVPDENHWPVASHRQTLSHNFVSSTPCHERGSNSQL